MSKRKRDNEITSVNEEVLVNNETSIIVNDNPMSKVVEFTIDDEVLSHNRNNEVLRDSDLINNVII